MARALAERLYRNETYVLGVDSHCHFLRGWDNVGIDMFRRIGNDLAIITSYPASYGAVRLIPGSNSICSFEINPFCRICNVAMVLKITTSTLLRRRSSQYVEHGKNSFGKCWQVTLTPYDLRRVNIHTTVTFKHDMNRLKRPKHGPVRVAWFAAGTRLGFCYAIVP